MIRKLEGYFLNRHYPPSDPRTARALLTVRFAFITFGFALVFCAITFITGFVIARYAMMACMVMFGVVLFGLRMGLPLSFASHYFIFSCWLMVNVITFFSGGLHSVAISWNSLIAVSGLMLAGRRGMRIWAIIVVATLLFYFFAQGQILMPEHLQAPNSGVRSLALHLGLVSMIGALVYVFHRQGRIMLRTIQHRNTELNNAREMIEKQRDEIAARNENLEAEVQKRTKELLDYNHQLEQFAFIASHDLRAPVASLLGLGHLLEVKNLNDDDREQINRSMITTARELDRVVRDLSTILEMRQHTTDMLRPLNLEEQLTRVRVSLERELAEADVDLQADFSAISEIRSIRPLMDSILINLVSNAVKYRAPDRQPRIRVRTERSNGEWCLSVSDNGLGIDLDVVGDKLFSLYSRFHTHVDGKGLGLYLVKTHVDALGGRIEVQSKIGEGTTFRVYLKE